MNALNPLQSSTANGADPRVSEPSMEEILASIRRIIADDQSLPAQARAEASVGSLDDGAIVEPAEARAREPAVAVDPRPHIADDKAPPSALDGEREEATPHDVAAPIPPEGHGPIAAAQIVSSEPPPLLVPESATAEIEEFHSASETTSAEDISMDTVPAPSAAGIPPVDAHTPPVHATGDEAAAPHADPDHAPDPEPLFSEATDRSIAAAFNVLAASRIADNSEELLHLARDMIRPLLKAWIDENVPGMVQRMVRAEIERMIRGRR